MTFGHGTSSSGDRDGQVPQSPHTPDISVPRACALARIPPSYLMLIIPHYLRLSHLAR